MSDPMNEYGKIEVEKNGSVGICVQKGLSLWEDHEDGTFEGVIVDTAGSPCIPYDTIPKVIEYLAKVHEARKATLKLNTCGSCGQPLENER